VEFTHPANICFECNQCGLCCGDTEQKIRHILLLKTEADQIATQAGMPATEFATEIFDKSPYSYEMKKSDSGQCVFLKNNQCSIYLLRPLICRFYPFQLTFDGDNGVHVFDFTYECPGISHGKPVSKKDFEALFLLARQRLP
jgi:Fe-S-cluster containining protein